MKYSIKERRRLERLADEGSLDIGYFLLQVFMFGVITSTVLFPLFTVAMYLYILL